jgi:hypothetical protein
MQTEYFSHDYRARFHPKLLALQMREGLAGLGAYWCLVELVYECGGSVPVSDVERIAFELRTDRELVHRLIYDHGLFEFDQERFWSDSILERLRLRDEKRQKAAKSSAARWSVRTPPSSGMRTDSDRIATGTPSDSDRNPIKEKEKEKEKKEIKLPLPLPPPAPEGAENERRTPEAFEPTGLTKALLMRDDVAPAWAAFLAHRKRVKAPNTGYALGLVVKRLRELRGDDGPGWAELLNVAVERGWRSVYETNKPTTTTNTTSHDRFHKPTLAERYNDRAREFIARHGTDPSQ